MCDEKKTIATTTTTTSSSPSPTHFRFVEKRPKVIAQNLRHDQEVIGSLCRLSNRPASPKTQMEQERRLRREIANSNERRRMQSINAGFQSLRALLPHHEGEKLSKAAILQQTTQYIYQVDQEKTRLLSQNCQLKRLLNQQNQDSDGGSSSDSPLPKRKKSDPGDSVDEGIASMSPPNAGVGGVAEPTLDDLKREMIELRIQLEHERRLRVIYEEQTRNLEAQMYPERLQAIVQPVQIQYEQSSSPPQYLEERAAAAAAAQRCDVKEAKGCVDLVALAVKESRVPPIGAEELLQQQQQQHRVKDEQDVDDVADDKVILIVAADDDNSNSSKRRRVEVVTEIRCRSPRLFESPPPKSPPPQAVPALKQPIQPMLYFPSTSRQNLETIVEAIRHLEGDHLFSDDALPLTTVASTVEIKTDKDDEEEDQEVEEVSRPSSASATMIAPLSPTDLSYRQPQHQIHHHNNNIVISNHHHHAHVIQSTTTTAKTTAMQPSRPGVIVSAHS